MSGWIVTTSEPEAFRQEAARLRRVFDVPGVPPLRVETRQLAPRCQALVWSWAEGPAPDTRLAETPDGAHALLLEGAVTGLGRHGAAAAEPGERAAQVVRAWAEEGSALVPELDGSFSAVFLDRADGRLTFYADRFASRAVWVLRSGDAWYAGNYPAALAAMQATAPKLDPAGLWSLLVASRHVGARGLYHGMRNLHGGQYVVLPAEGGGEIEPRYWMRKHYRPEYGVAPRRWSARLLERLAEASAGLGHVTPSPYLFLSGGLDSRVAAGVMGGRSHNLTLTTERNMNARLAERVSKAVGAPHRTIERAPYWYLDTFEAAALVAGGNYNLRNAHFMVPARDVRAEDPAAAFMLGDLFEHFNKHHFKTPPDVPATFVPEEIPTRFHRHFSYTHPAPERLGRLLRPGLSERLAADWHEAMAGYCREIREVADDDRDCLDALARWYNGTTFPTYLMLECIRPLAEERNLMFDNAVSDLYHRIPAEVRGAGVLHRWTLWQLGRGLALIPDANFWMPPLMPHGLKMTARKVRPYIGKARRALLRRRQTDGRPVVRTEGSWHTLHTWYREEARHRRFVEACLFDEACLPPDVFDPAAVRACWDDFLRHPGDRQYAFEVDVLLAFGLLHRRIPSGGLA